MILRSLFAFLGIGSLLVCVAQGKLPRRDAAVEAIMVPSDDPRYAALNPAVQEPRIILRNNGSDPLAAISIRYGTEGFLPRMFAWTGHLGSGTSTEVQLPHLIDMRSGSNTFTVTLGDPNGRKDKRPADNTLSVPFTAADALKGQLSFRLRTAGGAGGMAQLENTRGPVPLEWKWPTGTDTLKRETLELPAGSYVLTLSDSGRASSAALRILNDAGMPNRVFRSKARTGTVYQFRVDDQAPVPETLPFVGEVLGMPGRGRALVDAWSQHAAEIVIRDAEEEPVDGWALPPGTEVTERVDLADHRSGTYRVLLRQNAEETEIGRIELP